MILRLSQRTMKRLIYGLLGMGILLPVTLLPAHAMANSDALETRVRAAFLFNFARYTEWPNAAIPAQTRFRFCVAESEDVKKALESTLADKQILGSKPSIDLLDASQTIDECHLLYVPQLSEGRQRAWLEAANNRSILVISEGRDFPKSAPGMVGFFLVDGRIRFAINPTHVNQAGLQMSSRLLGLAEIVNGNP